jgi:hypothetical protein
VTFHDDAWFAQATFQCDAEFDGAEFWFDTQFAGVTLSELGGSEALVARACSGCWERRSRSDHTWCLRGVPMWRASGLATSRWPTAGAHNLDKLRLEADLSFATAPSRLGRLTQGGSRLAIAEERAWRASQSHQWAAPRWPEWPDEPEPPATEPSQIAGLYRALRRGREDIKDEPGAADFQYG